MKNQATKIPGGRTIRLAAVCALFGVALWIIGGCSVPIKPEVREPAVPTPAGGAVISGRTGAPVSWEDMQADLQTVRIIYVGENHNSAAHHEVQQRVIRA